MKLESNTRHQTRMAEQELESKRYSSAMSFIDTECACLSTEARNIEAQSCTTALDYYQADNPTILGHEHRAAWTEAQKLVRDRVATALQHVHDNIKPQIAPTACDQLSISDYSNTGKYECGHVEPWMKAELHEAAILAVKKALIEIDIEIMMKPESHTCILLHLDSHPDTYSQMHSRCSDPLTNPYINCLTGSSLCLCKDLRATDVIEEQIDTAYYRLDHGWDPLLDEPDALRKAKEMAYALIARAGQDAKEVIAERDDVQHRCYKGETKHMKVWMQWHVERACNQAQRQFIEMMWNHPKQETEQKTKEREAAMEPEADVHELPDGDEHPCDEIHDFLPAIDITGPESMPYAGCKCLLWGANAIAKDACMGTMRRMRMTGCSWVTCLMDSVTAASVQALDKIGDIVSTERRSNKESSKDASQVKDHFPVWQQEIVKELTDEAARGVEEQIKLHGKDPGAMSEEATEKAQTLRKRVMVDALRREGDS